MKKILIADDEPDILKIVRFRLIKMGYEVIVAVNGQEALEYIEKEKPDLILLDISMPLVSGEEVCRQVKSGDDTKHTPVVLMTASTKAVTKENVAELGAEGFLLKPFETEQFLEMIRKFLD